MEQDCLIHPSAIVHPQAQLDSTVRVGPYAVVGPKLRIGAHTVVGPHCVLEGDTQIGSHNQIFQFASLGAQPQDKKYAGEPTRLVIGDRNTIREFCTFNTGTAQDRGETTIGAFLESYPLQIGTVYKVKIVDKGSVKDIEQYEEEVSKYVN